MARSLAEAGIDTTVIHDAATYAIMARVNKVLLPAHAVLVSLRLTAGGCSSVCFVLSPDRRDDPLGEKHRIRPPFFVPVG